MPRIQQLTHDVVTKIAAGEVIERPASVIKELVENSLDAGARRIDVEIENGGIDRIIVVDDGCGIARDDLPLAFASHATSKLSNPDDLFRISTMGFRGEALASIGGVAQVTLQSRPAGSDVGAEVYSHGGQLSPIRPWNGAPGTRIEVKHLFFNVPVRKKFLKTTATESGQVTDMMTRLGLAFPSVHFSLTHNGKRVWDLPKTEIFDDRVAAFFGNDIRSALYSVDESRGPVRVHGRIADPVVDRGNAKMQYLFLNGRWIRDRGLGHAIQEGYRGLLMTGRFAIAFLFLELPPDLVDVNVHPTKSEVRFRDSSTMFHVVLSAIRNRLNRANLIPRFQMPTTGTTTPSFETPEIIETPAMPFATTPMPAYDPKVFAPPPAPPVETRSVETPIVAPARVSTISEVPRPIRVEPPEAGPIVDTPRPVTPHRLALQIHDSYLVLETADGMLVIDQHALHERILYEQFQRRMRTGSLERQRLLIPEPVDLPADQAGRVLEVREQLAELGMEVEGFGGGTVLIHSYPTLLDQRRPADILRDVVDFLNTQDRLPTRDILLNELTSMMACKAAVKAGDRLTPEQIAALLDLRQLAIDSHHCPHGRPTQLLFSRQELDKQFRRT